MAGCNLPTKALFGRGAKERLALRLPCTRINPGAMLENINLKKKLSREDYRSEEHTSELQSRRHLVCRLLLEKYSTKLRESSASLTCTSWSRFPTPPSPG